ncbi:Transcriptional regulatory protein AfsQ1 [Roseivivax jejudonensis]|uniref:Transcriptional regulatory protein AfsQ1 n=1 Tax=Roseivivax jejudonensis TaxID=1529041 RepID=A0A1X6ZRV7_9RHOB|nr:SpoIIE family protein phosphatase [Roseivivax jejudonensis]SLN57806.1 Transcriptional regulatory protein AfsQ1 [Roseivivax jejudonensis]
MIEPHRLPRAGSASPEHGRDAAPPGAAVLPRILVVDDSAGQRMMLSRRLGRWGYRVTEARDASEALAHLAEVPHDIVLSDWMMPGMDGLELCRRLRAMPRRDYSYFILLTSKSDKAEVARGLDAGADDFVSKPVNPAELRARLNAGARILSMQAELQQQTAVISDTLHKLRGAYDAIERDLRQARTIQQALVPRRSLSVGATEVSLLFKPCGHVGGDLVGMFSPGHGRLGVYAIDVSGHGITSAMVTARVAGYLNPDFPEQNLALEPRFGRFFALRRPEEVVRQLNARLMSDPGVDEYLTMAYASCDLDGGRIDLVQAGHPSPLLLRADGRAEFVGLGGLPVGLMPEVEPMALSLRLSPGDRLLLYSDGVTEAETRTGGMLGEDGLLQIIRACWASRGTEFLDELFWRLSQAAAPGDGFQDDVSAALLDYRPGAPG